MRRPSWCKTSNRFRTLWSLIGVSTLLTLSMAQGDNSDARYKHLGHRLVCMCDSEPASGAGQRGCKQILLECTHIGCQPSKHMRAELSDALGKGESDEAILHSFEKEYGAVVIEQSSTVANKFGWLLALAALTFIAIALVRKRKARAASASMPLGNSEHAESLRERVGRETEKFD